MRDGTLPSDSLLSLVIGSFENLPLRFKKRVDIKPFEIWTRDNNCCAICGTASSLTFSHTKGKGRGGNNAGSIYGICKCMACHIFYGSVTYEKYAAWLLKEYGKTIPGLIVANWIAWLDYHKVSWYFKLGAEHIRDLTLEELAEQVIEDLEKTVIDFYAA